MKKVLIIVALMISMFATNVSVASDANPTKITQVLVGPQYGNRVLITVSPKAPTVPGCQVSPWYDYSFDGSTESGKITLSVVMAAYAAQRNVWIGGKNTCTV
ncbi:hypothetical protein EYS14_03695 [Alteromonadaceae bacterium M269]|nr:hypothetical protein EYS14_03695 [Alteromonadaceae bacterium M269]